MLSVFILAPFAGSLIAIFFPSDQRGATAWFAGAIALLCFLVAVCLYPFVTSGGVLRYELAWMPELGLNFTLRMDGFAWLFTVLVTAIGVLVVLYARYYMAAEDPVPRFFALFLAFMGSMLGVVLSGNLILLAVFWELTSIVSFLLIGYWHHNAHARDGARMALTMTGMGGLCMLVGLLIMGRVVGSYDLDVVLASGDTIRNHPLYVHDAGPDPARGLDQERAVPVPFLAAARDGSTNPRLRLSAFGDDGEGRRVPARPVLACDGRHRRPGSGSSGSPA